MRYRALQLAHSLHDALPNAMSGKLAGGEEVIGAKGRDDRRGFAMLFDDVLGHAPNVLVGHHLPALRIPKG